MANIAIFRINYKSDFILTLNSDAGWAIPFCIKFWTGAPSQAYFVGFDGTTYTHCAPVDGEPTKLRVQFDDHHLPIGDLKFQIAYHFTVADFPNDTEDEVINPANITTEIDGQEYQVMLDFTGETAPEIKFSLPAYANEAQRIANEQQRIAAEQTRIDNETQRIQNEEARINQEQTRQDNEAQRIRNEQTRINQEEARVREFATLKSQSQAATRDANDAAALANQKAQLAADKAQLAADKAALAQDAANLANQKALLAADKAALANDAAALANEKAALAQQKAEYAQTKGGYAKDQGDYAKEQGDYAKRKGDDAAAQMQQQAQAFSEAQAARQTAYEQAEGTESGSVAGDGSRWGAFKTNEAARDAKVDAKVAEITNLQEAVAEGAVYDISANNSGATYADLTAALGPSGANVPEALRRGGMSVKFVQSSDNNYVKFFCTADEFSTDVEDWEQAASIEKLESGDIVPKLAQNLESWEEDGGQDVSNTWDETIRTTAGDDPIDTTQGGVLKKIVAKTDFVCSGLLATAYNQLRLKSNGGGAVAVGTGWYFPVPKLTLGDFGSAQENNGLLLTDNNGNNIQNATVYFKALADGVPTSVTDGAQLSPTSVSYKGKTYKVYTTSGAGYLIVSGITYDNTCAHISWEDWYDKFVSPTDPADVGDNISLTALFTAAPNGSGKFLVCGGVATYAERISNTQMKITDPIGRVTSPSWTNTLQDDGETYLHSLTVSGMKSGGYALIEGSDQILIVEGTTVKYSDTNATAISGVVRYEKSTVATAAVTLTKTAYVLNDCGIEMKEGAEGSSFFTNTYTQNIPDALSQIAKVKLDSSLGVIAEALLYLYNENKALREILTGRDNAIMAYIRAINIECEQITMFGAPLVLRCSTAGAPSAANIPVNWDEKTMDVWNGTPRFRGQQYIDTTNSKVYYAVKLTGSTSDWVALN